MSGFALAAGLVTLITMVVLVLPLVRRSRAAGRTEHELAVYQDQLAELDRDVERGVLAPDQRDAAATEIQRRLLQASRTKDASVQGQKRWLTAIVLTTLLPAAAGLTYLYLGRPGLPDQPFAARDTGTERDQRERLVRQLAQMEERADSDGLDVEGWQILARLKLVLEGPDSAILALRRGLEAFPDQPGLLSGMGEALTQRAEGVVTAEAKRFLNRSLEQEPDQPQAHYLLGLAENQEGQPEAALKRWGNLLARAPSDAPWRNTIAEAYLAVADQLGEDGEALLAERPGVSPPGRPSAADVERFAGLSEDERNAQIRSMVEGLAARLEDEPDDIEGWLRLARARTVLGEADAARDALATAARHLPEDASTIKAVAMARTELGEEAGVPIVDPEAAALFERAAQLAPDDPEIHWYLGLHAVQTGDHGRAKEAWHQVLALLPPDDPNAELIRRSLDALENGPPPAE
ncbi:MAG: c-type cytochrome biogenesis protein CcmI [Geminicoccaceae bacterium]